MPRRTPSELDVLNALIAKRHTITRRFATNNRDLIDPGNARCRRMHTALTLSLLRHSGGRSAVPPWDVRGDSWGTCESGN
jgi:hypothetical protein